ncbi:hypothetical protein CEXT_662301 [Caerostris extrusa]|uniref:Uncharacterized protein n=1 Tax=Caerostris extrusa TaxID=172846 RepID=A0AAV4NA34_CAEEX|nr:hypothetical protein CEXT_662301 [Caerostris extrusa]
MERTQRRGGGSKIIFSFEMHLYSSAEFATYRREYVRRIPPRTNAQNMELFCPQVSFVFHSIPSLPYLLTFRPSAMLMLK